MSIISNQEDLNNLRYSCRVLMSCHFHFSKFARAGLDAKSVDDWFRKFGEAYDCTPAFLGYQGYEYTINFSIDNEITHGLPVAGKSTPDDCLLKIDSGFIYKNMYSDAAVTYMIGDISEQYKKIVEITNKATWEGIKQVKSGVRVGDIGFAIDKLATKNSYGNVKTLGGHGLGYELHAAPFIPHYGKKNKGAKLFTNQVITIEPMFNIGTSDIVIDDSDGWTVTTADGSKSAQFEHVVLVTKSGYEVLTDIAEKDMLPLPKGLEYL